jgi:class 3 adenylate cyclase
MSAATILFTDIVGFSRKPTAEQKRLVEALTAEVIHELHTLLRPPMGTPSIVALPTGDGIALAFLHDANQPWNRVNIFRLILRIQKWAGGEVAVSLRIGVHVGAVELFTDVNGRPNICGDTINYTQRVMDAASPKQVLFSESAFREYVGAENQTCTGEPFPSDVKAEFVGPIEVFAKHELQIPVYKMTLEPSQAWWSNEDPVAKGLMLVTLTPLPKEIVGPFSERVQTATTVALIQLTGDRFLAKFHDGQIRFSDGLKRLWVFMPDPETYAHLSLSPSSATTTLVRDYIGKWRELLETLKKRSPRADLKLGLFKEPPYFGASFVDWDRSGGVIHVSPYVWNVPAPDCPGYDLKWIGKKPSAIYEVYVQGLDYLNAQTVNAASSGR